MRQDFCRPRDVTKHIFQLRTICGGFFAKIRIKRTKLKISPVYANFRRTQIRIRRILFVLFPYKNNWDFGSSPDYRNIRIKWILPHTLYKLTVSWHLSFCHTVVNILRKAISDRQLLKSFKCLQKQLFDYVIETTMILHHFVNFKLHVNTQKHSSVKLLLTPFQILSFFGTGASRNYCLWLRLTWSGHFCRHCSVTFRNDAKLLMSISPPSFSPNSLSAFSALVFSLCTNFTLIVVKRKTNKIPLLSLFMLKPFLPFHNAHKMC